MPMYLMVPAAFQSRSVSFRVVSPDEQTFRVAPLTDSPPGEAAGELFAAGLGHPADYPSGGIGGRIALVQRGEIEFGAKLRNAAAAGASAVVIYDPAGDITLGTATGTLPQIPILTIPGADGVRLRERLKSETVRAELSFCCGVQDITALNVVGRSPGQATCEAVVGGHFDSVPVSPGASATRWIMCNPESRWWAMRPIPFTRWRDRASIWACRTWRCLHRKSSPAINAP